MIGAAVLLLFMVFVFIASSANLPSPPPSLTDPGTRYTIEKEGRDYVVVYHNGGRTATELIGMSAINLAAYRGAWVHIQGQTHQDGHEDWPLVADEQCIARACHPIASHGSVVSHHVSAVVVNIDSVRR